MTNITLMGVLNDTHGPWHDPRALNLVLDVFEDIGINHLVLNGDILDFYNVNGHGPKSPDVQQVLEDELYWGQDFISHLRKQFPKNKTKITYLFGNHEDRLNRFILRNCPAFWNIVKVESQLNLDHYDIEWFPYNWKYQVENTKLRIQHSPPSYAENAAMTSLKKKLDTSSIYGCTHRMDFACKTGDSGELHSVWMNGWLGSTTLSKEHYEVYKYTKGHESWQWCAILAAIIDGKYFSVNQFPIKKENNKYWAVVNGFYYEG